KGFVADVSLAAAPAEFLEDRLAALLERLAHFGRDVDVGLKAERARDVVKKSSFDRHGVDHVLAEERAAEALGHPQGIVERALRVLRAVERNQDILDHIRAAPRVAYAAWHPL